LAAEQPIDIYGTAAWPAGALILGQQRTTYACAYVNLSLLEMGLNIHVWFSVSIRVLFV